METLARAPKTFTMASRCNPEFDLCLDRTKTYVGTDGSGIMTVDLNTGQRRASRKSDVAMMALVSDYLPQVSFYWPMVSAQDIDPKMAALHELEASLSHTEKHVHLMSCVEKKTAAYAAEIAAVVAGSRKQARERPPLSLFVCAVSPLNQDEGSLEAALAFAEAGLPVVLAASPILGLTGPASLCGTMVMANAEILSGLCLIQLIYPGTPVCYTFFHDVINPITGTASALKKSVLHAAMAQIGHYYDLPVMSAYGITSARAPGDWQAGKEGAVDALFVCLAGPELLPALGLLEATTVLYPEKILFDAGILDSVRWMTERIEVDSDSLALDEIMAIGPGGHFLDRDYTCENLRRLWQPGISHQWSPQKGDFRDPQEVATEKIQWILKHHRPRPLDEKVRRELGRILKAAEKELTP
jgi:trimethylamine--corrinoid protein Co-methyltransferase